VGGLFEGDRDLAAALAWTSRLQVGIGLLPRCATPR
jgi:hypothetical protein